MIAQDPFVLATPKKHALARKRTISAEDLEGETVLLLDDGHCLRGQALSYCSSTQAHEASFRATSLSTLASMVSSGVGITLLPALSVPIENRRGQLAIRSFDAPAPSRTVALVWRPSSPMNRALRELAAVLRKAWPC